jgi:predicted dehydrogenase
MVGAGYMATEHLKALADVPGVELAGIVSRTRSRAEVLAAAHGVPHVCDTVEELLTRVQPHLTVVTTPELATREVCERVFAFETTVLVEKPAGFNLAEAEAVAAAATKAGRRVFVALNRRHYGSTRAMCEALAQVDAPRFISILDQEDPAAALRAGQPPAVVRNWMFANAIHLIDYFSLVGRGAITSVEPIVKWTPDNPGLVVACLRFSSGDVGVYQALWNGPGPWTVSVSTSSERWELRPIERAHRQMAGERQVLSLDMDPLDTMFKPGLRRQAALAVRAALGEAVPELPTVLDALVSMRLTHAIYF